jgi:hypothetical protein
MTWVSGNQYTYIPVWFELVRSGNTFTAYESDDGYTWFEVSSSTVSMPSTYYVGLAASSGDTSGDTTETSTFESVTNM